MKHNFLLFSALILTAFKTEWTKLKIDNNKEENMNNNIKEDIQPKKQNTVRKRKKTSQQNIESKIDETNQITVLTKTENQPNPKKTIPENQVKISEEANIQHETKILDIINQ